MSAGKRLFISHSHDSVEHDQWALELANRLHRDGFDCVIDQQVVLPPEGWLAWMGRQVKEADAILVIGTERYYGISHGLAPADSGMTMRWECVLDARQLSESGELRSRCVMVLPGVDDSPLMLEPLADAPLFYLQNPGGYEDLLKHLQARMIGTATPAEAPAEATPTEAPPAGVTLRGDLPCTVCDYNLRTLPLSGICPECGQPIELSVREGGGYSDNDYRDDDYTIDLAQTFDKGLNNLPALVEALEAGSVHRRRAAAYALSRMGPAGIDALPRLTSALNDPDADVRWWAAFALGRIGPTAGSAVPDLQKTLADQDVEVAAVADESLRKISAASAQQDTGQTPAAASASGNEEQPSEPLPAGPAWSHWLQPPPVPPPGSPHHQVLPGGQTGGQLSAAPPVPSWTAWAGQASDAEPAARGGTPVKWEYMTIAKDVQGWLGIKVNPAEIDEDLNRLGREGWELVSAFDTSDGSTCHLVFVFKRPVGT